MLNRGDWQQTRKRVGRRVEQTIIPRSDVQVLLFVLMMLVCSGIAVAYSAFKTRTYLAQLQELENQRDQMQVEWSQLLLEDQTWGSFARIGTVAEHQLQMINPAPAAIVMVRP